MQKALVTMRILSFFNNIRTIKLLSIWRCESR